MSDSKDWHKKGIDLVYKRQFREAIACYKNALEINPKHPYKFNVLSRLGLSHLKLNETQIASYLSFLFN